MRTSSLAAALALLVLGCGLENDGTGPQEPGPALPDPVGLPAPEFATASSGWSSRTPMPTGRYFHAAAAVNGVIYAVGGRLSNGTGTTSVQAYNPTNNTWATKAPLPAVRVYGNGAGVINGVLYLPGGADGKDVTKTLYAYNPTTNTWTTKAPMLAPGGCGASGVIAGKLYVYSGCPSGSTFQRYDPATNSWASLPATIFLHSYPAAAVIGGKFYLAGGNNSTPNAVLETFDPATNSWTRLNPMPTARFGGAGAALGGELYVMGGGPSTFTETAVVETNNPVTTGWRGRDPLPGPRVGRGGGGGEREGVHPGWGQGQRRPHLDRRLHPRRQMGDQEQDAGGPRVVRRRRGGREALRLRRQPELDRQRHRPGLRRRHQRLDQPGGDAAGAHLEQRGRRY